MLRRTILAALLLALGAATRVTRVVAFEQHQRSQQYEDLYYLPPAPWLPLLSLGYQSALADLLWCRSLVYFGTEFVRRGRVVHILEYTDAILTLDPDFREPYRWAPIATLYRSGDLDLGSTLRATRYLERAVKRWPNDGDLAWDLGSILRFELLPLVKNDPALKSKLEREAAELLQVAATLGAGPPWLALNSSNLLLRLGRTEQAIRHLEEVYPTVTDDATRTAIAAQLANLRSQSYAMAVREATEQFERSRVTAFPYLAPATFLLIGPRISEAERFAFIARDFVPERATEPTLDASGVAE